MSEEPWGSPSAGPPFKAPTDAVVGAHPPGDSRRRNLRPRVRPAAGTSSQARRVAGARRNPSVLGYDESVPRWLRTSAGWSWRLLVNVLAIACIFYAMAHVRLVFISVFLALVITSVLRPVTDLYSRIMPRVLATGLAILTALAVIAGMITYVVSSVAGQWNSLAKQFNDGIDQILEFLSRPPLNMKVAPENFDQLLERGRDWFTAHSGDIATQAAASAGSVVEFFAALALAIFCTVFFLARGRSMWAWFVDQLPARYRETWQVAGGAGWYTFSGYARGTVIIALTDAVMVAIFLTIIRVPLAAPLAVLVFIGAFIPIIGAPLAMVVAAVVALAADGVVKALIVTLGIALIGQIEGHVLQPLIMGHQVSLHPVVVAVAVMVGTLLAGILGAIVAVPMVAVVWSVYSRLRQKDPPEEDDLPRVRGRPG